MHEQPDVILSLVVNTAAKEMLRMARVEQAGASRGGSNVQAEQEILHHLLQVILHPIYTTDTFFLVLSTGPGYMYIAT